MKRAHLRLAAQLCAQAYDWESEHNALRLVGSDQTNTRALIHHDPRLNVIVVAIKGTEFGKLANLADADILKNITQEIGLVSSIGQGVVDLITDLNFPLHTFSDDGPVLKVHTGFLKAAQSITDEVFFRLVELSRQENCCNIIFTGHSLGAAIATILSCGVKRRMNSMQNVDLITFGSPHVGNRHFAEAVKANVSSITRFCCVGDVIPVLLSVFDRTTEPFQHVEEATMLYRTLFSDLVEVTSVLSELWAMIRNGNMGCFPTLATCSTKVLGVLMGAHAMDTYSASISGGAALVAAVEKLPTLIQCIPRLGSTVVSPIMSQITTCLLSGIATAPAIAAGIAGTMLLNAGNVFLAFQNNRKLHEITHKIDEMQNNQFQLHELSVRKLHDLDLSLTKVENHLEAQIVQQNDTIKRTILESHFQTANLLAELDFRADERHGKLVWELRTTSEQLALRMRALDTNMTALATEVAKQVHGLGETILVNLSQNSETIMSELRNLHQQLERRWQQETESVVETVRRELTQLTVEFVDLLSTGDTTNSTFPLLQEKTKLLLNKCLGTVKVALNHIAYPGHIFNAWMAAQLLWLAIPAFDMYYSLLNPATSEKSQAIAAFEQIIQYSGMLVVIVSDASCGLAESLQQLLRCIREHLSTIPDDAIIFTLTKLLGELTTEETHFMEWLCMAMALLPQHPIAQIAHVVMYPHRLVQTREGMMSEPLELAEQVSRIHKIVDLHREHSWSFHEATLLFALLTMLGDQTLLWFATRTLVNTITINQTTAADDSLSMLLHISNILTHCGCVGGLSPNTSPDAVYSAKSMLALLANELVQFVGFRPTLKCSAAELNDTNSAIFTNIALLLRARVLRTDADLEVARILLEAALFASDWQAPLYLYAVLEECHMTDDGLTCGAQIRRIRQAIIPTCLRSLWHTYGLHSSLLDFLLQPFVSLPSLTIHQVTLHYHWAADFVLERLAIIRAHATETITVAFPQECCALVHLKQLTLKHLMISELPRSIGHLTNLQVVDLSGNALTALPDEFGLLQHIEKLDLSSNQLQSFPDILCTLGMAREVFVSRNAIGNLPDDICKMGSLTVLDVSANQLVDIASKIVQQLARIEDVDLRRNPLDKRTKSVVSSSRTIKYDG